MGASPSVSLEFSLSPPAGLFFFAYFFFTFCLVAAVRFFGVGVVKLLCESAFLGAFLLVGVVVFDVVFCVCICPPSSSSSSSSPSCPSLCFSLWPLADCVGAVGRCFGVGVFEFLSSSAFLGAFLLVGFACFGVVVFDVVFCLSLCSSCSSSSSSSSSPSSPSSSFSSSSPQGKFPFFVEADLAVFLASDISAIKRVEVWSLTSPGENKICVKVKMSTSMSSYFCFTRSRLSYVKIVRTSWSNPRLQRIFWGSPPLLLLPSIGP